MSIEALSNEYKQTADILQQRLQLLKNQLKTANGAEMFALQKRIDTMYDELYQTRQTYSYLSQYYVS